MSPIYLGLVGPIASGKGVLAEYLKSLGFEYVSLSDQVRQELQSRGMEINRGNLMNVGDEMRKLHGNGYWANRAMSEVFDPSRNIVFDSIRNPGEITLFRCIPNFKIIGVDAPVEKRLVWYLDRVRQRGEDDPNMSAFIQVSIRDRGVNQQKYGQQVDECLSMSDIILQNGGKKEEIINELNKYLKSEFQFDPELHRKHKEK